MKFRNICKIGGNIGYQRAILFSFLGLEDSAQHTFPGVFAALDGPELRWGLPFNLCVPPVSPPLFRIPYPPLLILAICRVRAEVEMGLVYQRVGVGLVECGWV